MPKWTLINESTGEVVSQSSDGNLTFPKNTGSVSITYIVKYEENSCVVTTAATVGTGCEPETCTFTVNSDVEGANVEFIDPRTEDIIVTKKITNGSADLSINTLTRIKVRLTSTDASVSFENSGTGMVGCNNHIAINEENKLRPSNVQLTIDKCGVVTFTYVELVDKNGVVTYVLVDDANIKHDFEYILFGPGGQRYVGTDVAANNTTEKIPYTLQMEYDRNGKKYTATVEQEAGPCKKPSIHLVTYLDQTGCPGSQICPCTLSKLGVLSITQGNAVLTPYDCNIYASFQEQGESTRTQIDVEIFINPYQVMLTDKCWEPDPYIDKDGWIIDKDSVVIKLLMNDGTTYDNLPLGIVDIDV